MNFHFIRAGLPKRRRVSCAGLPWRLPLFQVRSARAKFIVGSGRFPLFVMWLLCCFKRSAENEVPIVEWNRKSSGEIVRIRKTSYESIQARPPSGDHNRADGVEVDLDEDDDEEKSDQTQIAQPSNEETPVAHPPEDYSGIAKPPEQTVQPSEDKKETCIAHQGSDGEMPPPEENADGIGQCPEEETPIRPPSEADEACIAVPTEEEQGIAQCPNREAPIAPPHEEFTGITRHPLGEYNGIAKLPEETAGPVEEETRIAQPSEKEARITPPPEEHTGIAQLPEEEASITASPDVPTEEETPITPPPEVTRILQPPKQITNNALMLASLLQDLDTTDNQFVPPPPNVHEVKRLVPYTNEYNFVVEQFTGNKKFNANYEITSVSRVWNPYLHLQYTLKKIEHALTCKEQYLFHGTEREAARGILINNFDWRKVRAGRFGWGVSFANNAWYASHYSTQRHFLSDAPLTMILAKVLVDDGDIAMGSPAIRLPPFGHTTANHSGEVLVKYDDGSFYPEFVVEFRPRPTPLDDPLFEWFLTLNY